MRGENIICATTTTGTGTLTLAACPSGIGGINPVIAFGTSGTKVIPYTLIEFTDATLSVIKTGEKGVGVLTLAATIGSATLTRLPDVKFDANGAAYDDTSPSAFSIGTAANCLVFIGPGTETVIVPHMVQTSRGAAIEAYFNLAVDNDATSIAVSRGYQLFYPYYAAIPRSVCRATLGVGTGGGSGNVTAVGLYELDADGHTCRLVLDFGSFDTSTSGTLVHRLSASAHFTETYVPPGPYLMAMLSSGGTGNASLRSSTIGIVGLSQLGLGGSGAFAAMAQLQFGDGSRTAAALAATFDLSSPPTNFAFITSDTYSNGASTPRLTLGHA